MPETGETMPKRAQAPIVGRKEMAAILGIHPNNTHRNRLPDLPPPLQEQYGPDVIDVSVTPLWFREDIERYAQRKADEDVRNVVMAERRKAAANRGKSKSNA
jgi:hypothetical protein